MPYQLSELITPLEEVRKLYLSLEWAREENMLQEIDSCKNQLSLIHHNPETCTEDLDTLLNFLETYSPETEFFTLDEAENLPKNGYRTITISDEVYYYKIKKD